MSAIDAFGTVWAISTDGGTTFTAVAQVTNIGVLDIKADTIETSDHDSADQYRTFIGGMVDGGELKFDINYDPSVHGTLLDNVGKVLKHKVTLTDAGAATVEFDGIITGLSAEAPFDDKLAGSASVKVSGKPVITP
jgi:predicted secreted protein